MRGLTQKDIERLPHMSEQELMQFVERLHERSRAAQLRGEAMLLEHAVKQVDCLFKLACTLPLEGRFRYCGKAETNRQSVGARKLNRCRANPPLLQIFWRPVRKLI
jgi:hypothetical protein